MTQADVQSQQKTQGQTPGLVPVSRPRDPQVEYLPAPVRTVGFGIELPPHRVVPELGAGGLVNLFV
jgi:hypothetical protein